MDRKLIIQINKNGKNISGDYVAGKDEKEREAEREKRREKKFPGFDPERDNIGGRIIEGDKIV